MVKDNNMENLCICNLKKQWMPNPRFDICLLFLLAYQGVVRSRLYVFGSVSSPLSVSRPRSSSLLFGSWLFRSLTPFSPGAGRGVLCSLVGLLMPPTVENRNTLLTEVLWHRHNHREWAVWPFAAGWRSNFCSPPELLLLAESSTCDSMSFSIISKPKSAAKFLTFMLSDSWSTNSPHC